MSLVTATRAQNPMPTGFLDLPYELRHRIYCHCIPRRKQVDVQLLFPGLSYDSYMEGGFLRLSKQIAEECLDILYGENIFRLCLNGKGEYYMRNNFTEKNRHRMRYLIVTADPAGVSYERSTPDDSLWATILPRLKCLLLIAEQPIQARRYYDAPTLRQDIDTWLAWIRPYLESFGQHIPEPLSVTVDDDDRKETRELVQKYLPPSCRLKRSALGDFLFRRGRFSIESGYWDDCYDGPTSSQDV
ncbi:hypothetical protein BDV26DRAFT_298498 [Aspergillus bertholletiae]|uniref:Uncharacterized protein n=1 Tax=Aspergillus bertholletiae TaxID=1226010 RepID=A0A5N7ASN0_9EURO|nr:hypothetical protein BDV26DRAFT_298498 [Aspergillus bertholletiae]